MTSKPSLPSGKEAEVLAAARPIADRASGAMARAGANAALPLSPVVVQSGEGAARRFLEFFAVTIRNKNTRRAYLRAACRFLDFCDAHGVRELRDVQPMMVAAFIEKRSEEKHAQTAKQDLAAVRQLFDYLTVTQVVPVNPASSVKGPSYTTKRGKTPVLSREQAKRLLDSIPTERVVNGETGGTVPDLLGLRDRALLALMVYSFARVGAVVGMKVGDYYANGKTWWVRLHEKGGKFHEVPVHHKAEEFLDTYLEAAGIGGEAKSPLFRSAHGRGRYLTGRGLLTVDVLRMIKRRALAAGLPSSTCCHTFRATGITAYLESGGTVENAQAIAAHESPRTTKLYDRRSDAISLDEIERIVL